MNKNLKTDYHIGTVKQDCSKDSKVFAGIELIVFYIKGDEKAIIFGGATLEETEKFFKASYENGGKESISDDYEKYVWLLLNEHCELVPYVKISDLENIRVATQEDTDKFDKIFAKFKKVHKFAEREQEMMEQEEKEQAAIQEFKKLPKQPINIAIKMGEVITGVPAVIYKDFAIHDPIDAVNPEDSIYKTITVIKGKGKGKKLLDCNVTKCKRCIDEIRAVIGNKVLETSDSELIKPIIDKY